MPLFPVKKEIFEWIRTGQKSIELRRGKAKKGDEAVFQCGRNIIRGIIVKKEEGSLTDVFREDNYKKINPNANNLENATAHLKMLYEKIDGTFTAYTFKL